MKGLPAVLFLALSFQAAPAYGHDWLHWRGPEQTGVSRERDLPEKWSLNSNDKDSNLIWKAPYGARNTPLVMGGRVFILNDADEGVNEQERIMCFDADTGKVLWERRFNVFLVDIVSSRVGWTNLAGDAETGYLYAHGTQGYLMCLDRDGKTIWERSLIEEVGRFCGYGGRLASPLVDGDLVMTGFVNASYGDQARGANRFLAVDKRTGAIVWWSDTGNQVKDTYYSSPVVGVIGGQRLMVCGGGDGYLHAFKVRTGEKVWSYPVAAKAINATPVIGGNLVYAGNGEENWDDTSVQGKVVCVDGSKVKDGKPALVWEVNEVKDTFATPLLHEGRLYVADETCNLHCFDAATGKLHWKFKYGRGGARGSPVWADGKIYVPDVAAQFVILQPGPDSCKRLDVRRFSSSTGTTSVEVNGSPAIANGRIYQATANDLYCIGKKNHKTAADPLPPPVPEPPADPNAKAAKLLAYPGDVTLLPGGKASFTVRAYDSHGRFLKEVPADWTLPAPPPPPGAKVGGPPLKGTISPTGQLSVDPKTPNQQGPAVAKMSGLEARARVRVLPPLPFQQDFEKVPEGRTPGGWVNCQGKFAVEKKDGSMVLRKLSANPNPLLAKAYAYMGRPSDTDYTIEADVQGGRQGQNLPDMGIVANRYSLVLAGNSQELGIASWDALPRVKHLIPWPWKPDVWYRMKLTVDVKGDRAFIRGKVWPREAKEPEAWSIDFEDPKPNREGSPALYGYAVGVAENELAPIWFDNVRVTPHSKQP